MSAHSLGFRELMAAFGGPDQVEQFTGDSAPTESADCPVETVAAEPVAVSEPVLVAEPVASPACSPIEQNIAEFLSSLS